MAGFSIFSVIFILGFISNSLAYLVYTFQSHTNFVGKNGVQGNGHTVNAVFEVDIETLTTSATGLVKLKSCTVDGGDCEFRKPNVFVRWNNFIDTISSNENEMINSFLNIFQPLTTLNTSDLEATRALTNGLHAHYNQKTDKILERIVSGSMNLPAGGQNLISPPIIKVKEASKIIYGTPILIQSVNSKSTVSVIYPLSSDNPLIIKTRTSITLHEKIEGILKTDLKSHLLVPFEWNTVASKTLSTDKKAPQSLLSGKFPKNNPSKMLAQKSQRILKLLPSIRVLSSVTETRKFLKEHKEQERDVHISLLSICATMVCHETALDIYQNDADSFIEYLASLANAPLNLKITDDIMNLDSKNLPLHETILLTVANRVRRHCVEENNCQLVPEFLKDTEVRLRRCETTFSKKNPNIIKSCQTTVFDSLGNLQNNQSIRFISRFICTNNGNDPTMQYAVMQALQASLMDNHLPPDVGDELLRVFFNRCPESYGQTSRTLAGQILLDAAPQLKNGPAIIYKLFSFLTNSSSSGEKETSKLLWNVLLSKRERCLWYQTQVKELKAKMGYSYNYDTISVGQSSVFSSDFLSKQNKDGLAVKYHLDMELLKGLLKRSTVSVDWIQDNYRFPMTTFEIFSSGLDSFMGSADVSDGSDEEPSAAIRLGLMGSKERVIELFRGSGDMMAAVWAADGTPITAFKGNLLLNDADYAIPLQSGLTLNVHLQSLLSVQVSGSVEISVWFRTSKSIVSTSGGLTIHLVASLASGASPQTLSSTDLSYQSMGNVDFVTHINFQEDPPKLCMIIDQNEGNKLAKFNKDKMIDTFTPGKCFTHSKVALMCSEFDELTLA